MELTRLFAVLICTSAFLVPLHARAHGDPHAGKSKKAAAAPEQKPWGIAGDPKKVTRTIKMDMSDEMRYHPALVTVKQGETLRFALRNSGKIMHEMIIGTSDELKTHAEVMKKFPSMEHDEPYMAHVQPGKSQTLVWQFNRAGEFNYACLIPGHFEAGMVGKIVVKP